METPIVPLVEDLPADLDTQLRYRIAYGEAARLAEMARFDHGWGRDFAVRVGDQAGSIEREVNRRLSGRVPPELVRMAVEDALEMRRPRW